MGCTVRTSARKKIYDAEGRIMRPTSEAYRVYINDRGPLHELYLLIDYVVWQAGIFYEG